MPDIWEEVEKLSRLKALKNSDNGSAWKVARNLDFKTLASTVVVSSDCGQSKGNMKALINWS